MELKTLNNVILRIYQDLGLQVREVRSTYMPESYNIQIGVISEISPRDLQDWRRFELAILQPVRDSVYYKKICQENDELRKENQELRELKIEHDLDNMNLEWE